MPGGVLPTELDAAFQDSLRTPWALMGQAAQLWNLDARRKGREEIPLSEFGLSGTQYDPNQVSQRAWNAYNTIGAEQAGNARDLAGRPTRTWRPEPYSNRFSPGIMTAATAQAAQAIPTPQPVVPAPLATPALPNLAQMFGQAQSASPATVQPMATRPQEVQQSPMQQNALMNLFNFPTLRTKKPSQSSGGLGMPGQYNENFWNAWRI
jgi:hypothetical protein